jgi:hypothetical protein
MFRFAKKRRNSEEEQAFLACKSVLQSSIEKPQQAVLQEVPKPVAKVPKPKTTLLFDPRREDAFCDVDVWFRKGSKPLLLVASHGSGATCLLEKYGSTELYDDQDMKDFLSSFGLSKKRIPALIDSIEHLDASERLALKGSLKNSHRKLVMITKDLYAEPGKSLAKQCQVIKLDKPDKTFITSVLKQLMLLKNCKDSQDITKIVDMCNGNISNAVLALEFSMKSNGSSHIDRPDAQNDAVRTCSMLLAHREVPCIGGTSDISFVGHLLQLNSPTVKGATIATISKSFEHFSMLDVIESRHCLDHETSWTLVNTISKCGPKMTDFDKYWRTEFPKSTQKTSNPKFVYA